MSKYMQWYYCGFIDASGAAAARMNIFREQSLKGWDKGDYVCLDALDMLMGVIWLSNGWYGPVDNNE